MAQAEIAYWEHEDQIIWVHVQLNERYSRTMWGRDNYWIDWPYYGMWNDAENIGPGRMYGDQGEPGVAFSFIDGVEAKLDDWRPPEGVEVLRGFMLTDEQARFVGIL